MLTELSIRNYVLVEDVTLSLGPGLTVLTGETGAGKSLVVGALKLLLGAKADAAVVRSGTDAALVEGCFSLALDQLPGDFDDLWPTDEAGDGPRELILAREVAASGRSRAWAQGRRVPLDRLRAIAERLVDLHGQHEQQSLLKVGAHRDLVDRAAGLEEARNGVAAAHGAAVEARRAWLDLKARTAAAREREDLHAFQLQELEALAPEAGEEESLEGDARRLANAETIASAVLGTRETLRDREGSVQDLLGRAEVDLERAAGFDEDLKEPLDWIREASRAIDEAVRSLDQAGGTEFDPVRLETVQVRLSKLADMKRKYRMDHGGLVHRLEELREELDGLGRVDGDLADLAAAMETAFDALRAAAATLGDARRKSAAGFGASIEGELAGLGMEGARFEVAVEGLATPQEPADGGPALPCAIHGADRVELRIAANVGESTGSLAKVASGGEVSRVMLAVRTVLSRGDSVPVLVFDEVDAGIGGDTADRVATRLVALSQGRQAIVVTHQAAIASAGASHIRVEKSVEGDRTATSMISLEGDERVDEVARMLSGADEDGRVLARKLLERRHAAAREAARS